MKQNVAMRRYLERHIEGELPDAPKFSPATPNARWKNVIVIPCYGESPKLLHSFSEWESDQSTLIIVVLNTPESCADKTTNSALRNAIAKLTPAIENPACTTTIFRVSESVELYCHDLEQLIGPSPDAQGVGLARKVGCDIALLWQSQGAISGEWICSTDADAILPSDYFPRLLKCSAASSAAVFPFVHATGKSEAMNCATALYELRLHHYVLGLNYAKSPYAYHTLGSCIAVKRDYYAQVRGYPKRSAGEDFYLLNKLAKTAPITSLAGECIALQSRASARVPFGTGPAAQQIITQGSGDDTALFYHPQCFEALRAVLAIVSKLKNSPLGELSSLLEEQEIPIELCLAADSALTEMELEAAVVHCRKQGRSNEQFQRQFHQWFDGFRTLKFIHAIRAKGWEMQNLATLTSLSPQLFPAIGDRVPNKTLLRASILNHWHWTSHHLGPAGEN